MSDRIPRVLSRAVGRDFGREARTGRGSLTDYQRELQPIFQGQMEEEEKERNWLRPLQWALDRLQTGQYISANVANSIIESAQGKSDEERQTILEAIQTGITGEVKGTYEDILRDTLGVGENKIFNRAPEGTRRAQMDWADVLGFAADVLLDPLTYMTFGGATKGATKAAGEFADDSVRMYLRQLAQNPEDIFAKLTQNKFTKADVDGILARSTESARRHLMENGGDSLAKLMEQTYNNAYRQGLRLTQGQLQQSILKGQGDIPGLLDIGAATPIAQDIATRQASTGLEDIMQRVISGNAYQGGGETFGARFMGKELAVGPERAVAKVRRGTWDRFANFFQREGVGKSFSDAVWAGMNKGPVGELRRMLGFRNPYQKYLRSKELTQGKVLADVASNEALADAFRPLKDFSDDEVSEVLHTLARREAVGAEDISGVVSKNVLPSERTFNAAPTSGNPKVDEAVDKLKGVFDRWSGEEGQWATRLGENPADYREWYVPEKFRYRQSNQNVRRKRERTFLESYDREKELIKTMYGVDEDTAKMMMEADVTGLGTNFREALAERALVHGRAKARFNLTEQIKEMGIDLRDAGDPAANLLKTSGRDFKNMGMSTIDHPAFAGFVFDADVAEIAKRAIDFSGEQKNVIQRAMAKYASWWKGMVTATGGFHARNFMSNTMTQALKHGARAFNKKEIMQSTAAVAYAMRNLNPKKFLDEIGMNDQWYAKYLNQSVGNLRIKDLADEARRLGVISEHTMGFGGEDIAQKVAGRGKKMTVDAGPLRNVSRNVGNFVENIPRFQSFLIDYMDTAAKNIGDAVSFDDILKIDEPALNYAAQEAKKWFLDYTDLTEFEQKTLKNIIPFYSWLRKNLGNQLSGIVLYPEMYSLIPKVEDLMEYEDPDYDPAMIPEWMREEGMFPIGRTDEGMFRMFRPDFAYKDLNLIPLRWEEGDILPHWDASELSQDLINATAPWLRDIAGRMTTENGYNFFYRNELGETGDAPYLMRLMASRPGTIAFVDGLARMLGAEDGAKLSIDDEGKLQMDAQMAQTLEDYLPVLRQAEFLLYTIQMIPGLEQVVENVTMAEDDYEGMEQAMQLMAFHLGIKTKEADLDREKMQIGRDIYFQAVEQLNEDRRNRPGSEQRSLDYWNRTDDLIRRLQ